MRKFFGKPEIEGGIRVRWTAFDRCVHLVFDIAYETAAQETCVHTPSEALAILKHGVNLGLVSEQTRGDYPQNIWSIHDTPDRVFVIEAQLENRAQGVYHAYPLDPQDPFREVVLRRCGYDR